MHADEGLVESAMRRLRGASLIPPIRGVESVGLDESDESTEPLDNESVLITVGESIGEFTRERVAEARGSYELREVPPTHGVSYA